MLLHKLHLERFRPVGSTDVVKYCAGSINQLGLGMKFDIKTINFLGDKCVRE